MLPDPVRDLFDAANYATLSTIEPDGSPQASVIWVKSDGDDVVFSTVKGRRKHRNIDRDPRATVLIIDPDNPYKYAEIRGHVTMIDDPAGAMIQELSLKYAGRPWQEPHPDNERVIVRITPKKVHLR
jgi:PPOX class probable F420-dependent enzyme